MRYKPKINMLILLTIQYSCMGHDIQISNKYIYNRANKIINKNTQVILKIILYIYNFYNIKYV